MILTSYFDIFAVAAKPSEFSTGGGSEQWWTDLLASALSGLVLVPLALFFMWVFHRFRLDRWLVLTAVLSTILSVVFTSIMDMYLWGIYAFVEGVLYGIGVHRFMYMVLPSLFVCVVGAIGFGWWLKRRRSEDVSGVFE